MPEGPERYRPPPAFRAALAGGPIDGKANLIAVVTATLHLSAQSVEPRQFTRWRRVFF